MGAATACSSAMTRMPSRGRTMFFSPLRCLGARKDRRCVGVKGCGGVKVGRGLWEILRPRMRIRVAANATRFWQIQMLTLYFAPGSSSMAVHIALHEIGAPFQARPLSFARRELRTPEFLAINPEGKVPTLLVDGRRLTEVAAILFYLAKRFPAASLLPENDPESEAQAISWMSFIAATLHPARTMGTEHVM